MHFPINWHGWLAGVKKFEIQIGWVLHTKQVFFSVTVTTHLVYIFDKRFSNTRFFNMRTQGPVVHLLYITRICAQLVIGCPYKGGHGNDAGMRPMCTEGWLVLCVFNVSKLILSLPVWMFYRCVGGLFAQGPWFPLNYKMSLHRVWQQTPANSVRGWSELASTYLRMRHGANRSGAICRCVFMERC